MNKPKPKYSIGDRFMVAGVEYEVIRVISAPEPAYIFQHCELNSLKSVLTEGELNAVMNQKSA